MPDKLEAILSAVVRLINGIQPILTGERFCENCQYPIAQKPMVLPKI